MQLIPLLLRLLTILGVAGLLAATGFTLSAIVWLAVWLTAIALYCAWIFKSANDLLPRQNAPASSYHIDDPDWKHWLERIRRHLNEQQRDQQTVSDELTRVHAAVDHLPDGIVLLDRFHLVLWSNAAAKKLHAIVGLRRPIHHFIRHPDFVELLEGKRTTNSVRVEFPEAPDKTYELELVAQEETFIIVTRDVTEQVLVDRIRSDFIANISHEIRTPLTVVGGYAEALQELELSAPDRKRYLQMIVRQSETMRQLVEDLLTLSRLENSNASLDQQIDIQQLVEVSIADARGLSTDKHQFESQISLPTTIMGHQKDLESALRNLLSNAVHYTPAGGIIRVVWNDKRLSVQDSGIGISPEHIPRLTERFYRVDKSRSRDSGGTGLGLAIVKRIASRHAAQLEITSLPGKGSTFSIQFQ
jgi:two-component system, OmpR family, phosphate regulon sensor histidine kinase PhoR